MRVLGVHRFCVRTCAPRSRCESWEATEKIRDSTPGGLEAREPIGLEAWRPQSIGGGARAVSIESREPIERLETRIQEAWKHRELRGLQAWRLRSLGGGTIELCL